MNNRFFGDWYFFAIASVVAIVAGRSRHFLKSRSYIYTVKLLGLVLCLFGMMFIKDALVYFKWM